MQDPVSASDGVTYDRCIIEPYLLKSKISPVNGRTMRSTDLISRKNLSQEIAAYIEQTIKSQSF